MKHNLIVVALSTLAGALAMTLAIAVIYVATDPKRILRGVQHGMEALYRLTRWVARHSPRWADPATWWLTERLDILTYKRLANALGCWSYSQIDEFLTQFGDIPCFRCGWLCECTNTPEPPTLTLIQGEGPAYDPTMDPCSPEFDPSSWLDA